MMPRINPLKPALGAAALWAVFVAPPALAADYSAALAANPTSYSGRCPTTINFRGSITARKAGRVQYKFIRSDNAFAPIQTVEFTAPGTRGVSSTWQLGGPSLPSYSGWKAIQIVYPTNLTSNRAAFSIRCALPPPPKPEITGYRMPGPRGACVPKGAKFWILGRNFGSRSGKGVALGGHGIHVDLPVISWAGTRILATLPNDPRIQEGQWYYTGVERTDPHGGWLSNISKNITVCRTPQARKPDLVIRRFGLKKWGTCAPNNAVMTFQVTVANVGNAPSPAVPSYALVQVMDGHRNWGNGAMLNAIPPGGSQTVEIPVYYLQADPAHMTRGAPHPFRAKADPGNKVAESNEGNNQSGVINVGAPKGCK